MCLHPTTLLWEVNLRFQKCLVELGYRAGTVIREVLRNRSHHDRSCRPQLAEWYARDRRSRSRRNRQLSPADWAQIQALAREDWSPEQIAGHLKREQRLSISHETIYRYVWADQHAGGTRYTHLRGARVNPVLKVCDRITDHFTVSRAGG